MLAPDVRRRAERRVGSTLCRKWRLDSVVGCGGMATVYAATHRNQSRVAVKILHPELSIDDQIRSRFLREGYLANSIEHPGAVAVIDDDETEDGTAFLVMELLSGENLEQRLERHGGRLSRRDALNVTAQLLEVLRAAHGKGVVHRDIKPDNLFITSAGYVKVLDFGIACLHAAATGSTGLGAFYGTPGYAPPEQARGRSNDVDARSDLYAVGATLFTMLSGRPVHEAETATERLALTISLPARSISVVAPELPTELVSVVDRALRYDRDDRWPDAKSMLDALDLAREAVERSPEVDHVPGVTGALPKALERAGHTDRTTLDGSASLTVAPRHRKRRALPLLFGGIALLLGLRSLTGPASNASTRPSAVAPHAELRGLKSASGDASTPSKPHTDTSASKSPTSSAPPTQGQLVPSGEVTSQDAANTPSPAPSPPAPEKPPPEPSSARKSSAKPARATVKPAEPSLFSRRR